MWKLPHPPYYSHSAWPAADISSGTHGMVHPGWSSYNRQHQTDLPVGASQMLGCSQYHSGAGNPPSNSLPLPPIINFDHQNSGKWETCNNEFVEIDFIGVVHQMLQCKEKTKRQLRFLMLLNCSYQDKCPSVRRSTGTNAWMECLGRIYCVDMAL